MPLPSGGFPATWPLSRRGGTVIGCTRGRRVTLSGKAMLVAEGRIYP